MATSKGQTPITEVAMGWYANLNREFIKQFKGSLSKSEPIAIEAANILSKIERLGSVSDTELLKICFILMLFGASQEEILQASATEEDEREPEDNKDS